MKRSGQLFGQWHSLSDNGVIPSRRTRWGRRFVLLDGRRANFSGCGNEERSRLGTWWKRNIHPWLGAGQRSLRVDSVACSYADAMPIILGILGIGFLQKPLFAGVSTSGWVEANGLLSRWSWVRIPADPPLSTPSIYPRIKHLQRLVLCLRQWCLMVTNSLEGEDMLQLFAPAQPLFLALWPPWWCHPSLQGGMTVPPPHHQPVRATRVG